MNYADEQDVLIRQKVNLILNTMPGFCKNYFIGRENRLRAMTELSYANNLHVFFEYLHENNGYFGKKSIQEITVADMELLTTEDIEEFAHWLRFHEKDGKVYRNKQSTIEHYFAAISELYDYYIKRQHLKFNPVDAIDRQKKKKKNIVRLENDEKGRFLNAVEYGSGLTDKQLKYHEINKERDTAICKLFLGSGMRISELVGINVSDINFKEHCVGIVRKGGNEQNVYFNDEAEKALQEYLAVRNRYCSSTEEPEALFLNRDGERLSPRSIQKMIKKIAQISCPEKTDVITPHKLRSTYATDLLLATGDLALVSEKLGHASTSTTQIYADYANTRKHADSRNLV